MSDIQTMSDSEVPEGTGCYVVDWNDDGHMDQAPARYEVRFAFGGETFFEDRADAVQAAMDYQEEVAASHDETIRELARHGERERLAKMIERAENYEPGIPIWDEWHGDSESGYETVLDAHKLAAWLRAGGKEPGQ